MTEEKQPTPAEKESERLDTLIELKASVYDAMVVIEQHQLLIRDQQQIIQGLNEQIRKLEEK